MEIRSMFVVGMMLLGAGAAQQAKAAESAPAPQAQQTPVAKLPEAPAAKGPSPFATQKEKNSYALGMNIGNSLHSQGIDDIDANTLMQGLQDAISGGKTLLTPAEDLATLRQWQTDLREQLAAKNKAEGETFLAANKSKEGVVALPSGLQYKIVTAGTGPKPAATDTVSCNYRGAFVNGTEFDNSYKRGQAATFPVSGVIKGWTEALQLMPVGSKWQIFVPSDLAYGERGRMPVIEPNKTLIFEVELLSIKPKPPTLAPALPPVKK